MNVSVVSISKNNKERKICEFEMAFKKSCLLAFNLNNDDIISQRQV